MKKFKKIILTFAMALLVVVSGTMFSACLNDPVSIVSITKTDTVGLVDTYTIEYSDGSKSTFTVTNGKNGNNGADGADLSISDLYQQYLQTHPTATYDEFLKEYLTFTENVDNTKVINKCLQSTLKVYAHFKEYAGFGGSNIVSASYTGSAIIYKMDPTYTYVVTNYHVVYDEKSVPQDNSDLGKVAKNLTGYLYGSEGHPATDEYGHVNNGPYAIPLKYIGGSITCDLAVLQAKTSDVKKINENAKPVTLAETYHVGETAIAIGNANDEGISVTQGIISVDSEYIELAIDNQTRKYRSIRMDTPLYSGNSGGGLFNEKGELIGLNNAGDAKDQNVNFSIPLPIVKGCVNNILDSYTQNEPVRASKILLGITVDPTNSKYTYNEKEGFGKITEDVYISNVQENSTVYKMGITNATISNGCIIKSIYINNQKYKVDRAFDISDILLNVRVGDNIRFEVYQNNILSVSSPYLIRPTDLVKID